MENGSQKFYEAVQKYLCGIHCILFVLVFF